MLGTESINALESGYSHVAAQRDMLVAALTDATDALSMLATTLQPGTQAQKFADDAGFKASAALASIGK